MRCCSDAHCRLGVHTAVGDALRTPWPCPTAPSCKQSIAWAGLCAAVQQHTLARAVALTAMRLCGNPTVQMACWWARVGMDGLRNNTGWVTKRYGDDAVLGQTDGEDGVNLSHNVMYSACMYFVLVSMSSTVGAIGHSFSCTRVHVHSSARLRAACPAHTLAGSRAPSLGPSLSAPGLCVPLAAWLWHHRMIMRVVWSLIIRATATSRRSPTGRSSSPTSSSWWGSSSLRAHRHIIAPSALLVRIVAHVPRGRALSCPVLSCPAATEVPVKYCTGNCLTVLVQ